MATLTFHAPLLRSVAERLKMPPIQQAARAAGVMAIYRITVHYYDGRASDSLASLTRTPAGAQVSIDYERPLIKPLVYPITIDRYETFSKALISLKFDRMGDQDNLPTYDATDLWLIERAAGSFVHSVIVAPERAAGDHAKLVNAVKNGLPEALRMVR